MAQYNRRTVLTALGSSAVMFSSSTAAQENNGQVDIAAVRRATAQYQNAEQAQNEGYHEEPHCEPNMGVHFVNEGLLDGQVEETQPEALVYEPLPNGGYELVAVEYLVPGDGTETPPTLFDEAFDYNSQLGLWTLHVWCWRDNPNGMFAHHNPRVSCD